MIDVEKLREMVADDPLGVLTEVLADWEVVPNYDLDRFEVQRAGIVLASLDNGLVIEMLMAAIDTAGKALAVYEVEAT